MFDVLHRSWFGGQLPSRFVKLLGVNARLTQYAPERANGQFIVKWDHTPHGTLSRLLAEHHVAALLTHLGKAQSLKTLDHFAA